MYSWPEDIKLESLDIPNPSLWINLISPDKSLLKNSENESMDFFVIFLVIILVILAVIFFIIFKKRSSNGIK